MCRLDLASPWEALPLPAGGGQGPPSTTGATRHTQLLQMWPVRPRNSLSYVTLVDSSSAPCRHPGLGCTGRQGAGRRWPCSHGQRVTSLWSQVYCPECRIDSSEVVQAGEKLKESKKKAKMASATSSSQRDWGKVRGPRAPCAPAAPHAPAAVHAALPSVLEWTGHGVRGPHQGVHHRAVQPLWPHPGHPRGHHVEVQSPGILFTAVSVSSVGLSLLSVFLLILGHEILSSVVLQS